MYMLKINLVARKLWLEASESLRQRGGWVVGFLKRRDEQSLFLHTKMSNVGGG